MARQSSWNHRIPEIMDALNESRQLFFDRRDIESLFQIGRTAAGKLMGTVGAASLAGEVAAVGSGLQALVVSKTALVVYLARGKNSLAHIKERARRQELGQRMLRAREETALRSRAIPAAPSSPQRRLGDLPNVQILRGELRVRFSGPEDLLRQLWELSQAIGNDWQSFEEAANSDSPAQLR